ncbi:MAG TPA: alpha/beta hydrolase-fold protein [Pirellulales bacterium]|nr:alpha/beta hydrolase-fold protein [Pirellulales bacterium]
MAFAIVLAASADRVRAASVEFRVTLDSRVADRPLDGQLYVFLSAAPQPEPRFGPNWFQPEPFFRLDVDGFAPDSTRTVDRTAAGFPTTLDDLRPDTYYVQALFDHNLDDQQHGRAPGNLYTAVQRITIDGSPKQIFSLALSAKVVEQPFAGTGTVREIVRRSKLLSNFHGRSVYDVATVVLPDSYFDDPERRYPTIYSIPGFGGTHRDALRSPGLRNDAAGGVEFIRIMLSGSCGWGHHVYADSATNGPRGRALVEELIPYIDQNFRTIDATAARYVTGHSSGGWASLWAQVTHPDTFGGVWSTAPDPVDFRDFQRIDLYAAPTENMYRDAQGNRRPIARRNGRPVLWYDQFTRMDDTIGRGGQLRSFEAVFSPLDDRGQPRRLWNRRTGTIDPSVADAWQEYDIRLQLERQWPTIGSKLQGKLHIFVGSEDTFYLEGAVEKLAATLKSLESDAEVVVIAGKDHNTLVSSELRRRILREMSLAFHRYQSIAQQNLESPAERTTEMKANVTPSVGK